MTGTALIVADEIAEICDSNNIKAKIQKWITFIIKYY